MSGALVSLVGKKVLAESARNHFGTEDPYFEEVPASRLSRAFGKKKQKRPKAIPPGLSENDQKVLTKVKRRAYRLDYCLFNLCGIRFGWGSVIALIPFAGDVADSALAMMVVKSCEGIDGGLPARLRMMMLVNVIIDFLIGLVPFVGDLADAIYKCNTRNAIALEKHLREKGAKSIAKRQRRQGDEVDPSLPEEWDRQHATPSDDPPSYDQAQGGDVSRPAPARHASRGRSQRGWFGGSTHRAEDVEAGIADNSRNTRR
ncbi:PH domain protein [Aspergillus taichungensis]|uniref:PH domain protein n=1 Tax=Aspergillus taichungensis TaxID=482145 RepID=A0A2J5HFQ1_9EURO|nr:PH domain protein [Aspergillus taichungensis]